MSVSNTLIHVNTYTERQRQHFPGQHQYFPNDTEFNSFLCLVPDSAIASSNVTSLFVNGRAELDKTVAVEGMNEEGRQLSKFLDIVMEYPFLEGPLFHGQSSITRHWRFVVRACTQA